VLPNLTWDTIGATPWDNFASDPDAIWNLATLSVPDTLRLRLSESGRLIQSFSARQDVLRVRLSPENVQGLLSRSTRTDQLRIQLAETLAVAGVVVATDTISAGIFEQITLLSFTTTGDVLQIALAEPGEVASTLHLSDALRIELLETQTSWLESQSTDSLSVSLDENASYLVTIGSDSDFPLGKDSLLVRIINEDGIRCNDDWPYQPAGLNVWDRATGYWDGVYATWDSYETQWNWELLQGALPPAWAGQGTLADPWAKHDTPPREDEGCIT